MDKLNDNQQRAVTAGNGPVVIVAGPGTGKTKTLTARVAHLIASGAARPGQILALTFTKKSAQEMADRVKRLLGSDESESPEVSTFHALCAKLLDLGSDSAGGTAPQFATEAQRLVVIKQLQKPDSLRRLPPREIGLLISRAKNLAEDRPEIQKLLPGYNAALAELGLIDFDDLLLSARDLLQNDPQKRAAVQAKYTHILVDEFQDTNRLQYELLQLLCGHDNLFVIGDPMQSIYGFRGASSSIFDQFVIDYPNALQINLDINYRSAPQIVALSNALFADRPKLKPYSNAQGQARAVRVLSEYSEAAWVLAEIQKTIGGGDMLRAVSDDDESKHCTLRDFAIIYRSRSAAAAVQRAVAESGLPYQIVGDGSPYEHPQVQAIIALMRAAATGEPAKLEGFTKNQTKAVQQILGETDGVLPHALAGKIIEVLGFEPNDSLRQFVGGLVRFKDLHSAVAHLDKISETNFYDPSADALTLLTIHASKGLEFARVFLVAAEEGILPHLGKAGMQRAGQLASQTPPAAAGTRGTQETHEAHETRATRATRETAQARETDEEKRLFYVAITRAKNSLDITYTSKRGSEPAVQSRFITDLPPGVLDHQTDPNFAADARRAQIRSAKRRQQTLF